jgi:hypothetical protein
MKGNSNILNFWKPWLVSKKEKRPELEFFKDSIGTRNRRGTGLSYRPARHKDWRNSFLEIDSWAP